MKVSAPLLAIIGLLGATGTTALPTTATLNTNTNKIANAPPANAPPTNAHPPTHPPQDIHQYFTALKTIYEKYNHPLTKRGQFPDWGQDFGNINGWGVLMFDAERMHKCKGHWGQPGCEDRTKTEHNPMPKWWPWDPITYPN